MPVKQSDGTGDSCDKGHRGGEERERATKDSGSVYVAQLAERIGIITS